MLEENASFDKNIPEKFRLKQYTRMTEKPGKQYFPINVKKHYRGF